MAAQKTNSKSSVNQNGSKATAKKVVASRATVKGLAARAKPASKAAKRNGDLVASSLKALAQAKNEKVRPKGKKPDSATTSKVKSAGAKATTGAPAKGIKKASVSIPAPGTVSDRSEKLISSATEVARKFTNRAKQAVDAFEKSVEKTVEKTVERVSEKANKAMRSVEAALDSRKSSPSHSAAIAQRAAQNSGADEMPGVEKTVNKPRVSATGVKNFAQKVKFSASPTLEPEPATAPATFDEESDALSSEEGEEKSKSKKMQVFRSRAERLKVERLIGDHNQPVLKRWTAIYEQLKHLRAVPYDMSGSYDVKTPVVHKLLGWGFIVETRDERMDVMFKDGIKTLITNYKRSA